MAQAVTLREALGAGQAGNVAANSLSIRRTFGGWTSRLVGLRCRPEAADQEQARSKGPRVARGMLDASHRGAGGDGRR